MANEFRYLRTVRVTAAVYGGFPSQPQLTRLTLPHRAGVSTNTSRCRFADACVFGKQSPLSTPLDLLSYLTRSPFSRSYGVNLPSSLRLVLPDTLLLLQSFTCGGLSTVVTEAISRTFHFAR